MAVALLVVLVARRVLVVDALLLVVAVLPLAVAAVPRLVALLLVVATPVADVLLKRPVVGFPTWFKNKFLTPSAVPFARLNRTRTT